MKKVYVVANQKGGIGKTTTAVALATTLADRDERVLLIDCDTQCNSTDTFQAQFDGVATVYDVVVEDEHISLKDAIQHTEIGDIVAGDPNLSKADVQLMSDVNSIFYLKDKLAEISDDYDYVVIDTAPRMDTMLYNALIAADEVIIPVLPGRYGVVGLIDLYKTIAQIKLRHNPSLKIAGLLLVQFERTGVSDVVDDYARNTAKQMGTIVFNSKIRRCVKTPEAQMKRVPLIKYARYCTTQLDYEAFVDELTGDESFKDKQSNLKDQFLDMVERKEA